MYVYDYRFKIRFMYTITDVCILLQMKTDVCIRLQLRVHSSYIASPLFSWALSRNLMQQLYYIYPYENRPVYLYVYL